MECTDETVEFIKYNFRVSNEFTIRMEIQSFDPFHLRVTF